MPKAQKLGKTPTKAATSESPAAPVEVPKYTPAHLIVAKAEAFEAEMQFQVASTERQRRLAKVNEIATYLQDYEKRNSVPAGQAR